MADRWERLADIKLYLISGDAIHCHCTRQHASDWRYLRMAEEADAADISDSGEDDVIDISSDDSDITITAVIGDYQPPNIKSQRQQDEEGEVCSPVEVVGEDDDEDAAAMKAMGLPLSFSGGHGMDMEEGHFVMVASQPTPAESSRASSSKRRIPLDEVGAGQESSSVRGGEARITPVWACDGQLADENSCTGSTTSCTSGSTTSCEEVGHMAGIDWLQCGDYQQCGSDVSADARLQWQTCAAESVSEDSEQWRSYWSCHGEALVLQRWVHKYRDYVDPNYLGETELSIPSHPAAADNGVEEEVPREAVPAEEVAEEVDPAKENTEVDSAGEGATVDIAEEEAVVDPALEVSEEPVGGEQKQSEASWEDLWCDHRQQVYQELLTRFQEGLDMPSVSQTDSEVAAQDFGDGKVEDAANGAVTGDAVEQLATGEPNAKKPKRRGKKKKKDKDEASWKARSTQSLSVGLLLQQLQSNGTGCNADTGSHDNGDKQSTLAAAAVDGVDGAAAGSDRCRVPPTGLAEGDDDEDPSGSGDTTTRAQTGGAPGTLAYAAGALEMLGYSTSATTLQSGSPAISVEGDSDALRAKAAHVVYRQKQLKQKTRALDMRKRQLPELSATAVVGQDPCVTPSIDNGGTTTEPSIDNGGTTTEPSIPAVIITSGGKKKQRRLPAMPDEIRQCAELHKYWYQRYRLFSRFDEGVQLDREGWFSVTPERIACHLADRCRCDVIVDAFCGVGGNCIQFAKTCSLVIAVDMDPVRLQLARHNAAVYGVEQRIQFILGDFFEVAAGLRADAVFLAPPWGGPQYCDADVYDMYRLDGNMDGRRMVEAARSVSVNICLMAPRNADVQQLTEMAGSGGQVEVEQNLLNGRIKTITAYYGSLVKDAAAVS